MWEMVRELRESGVTIILTTHYIEEAEEMADRIGVINKGELIVVEDKAALMRKLGKKQLTLQLQQPLGERARRARRPAARARRRTARRSSTPSTRSAERDRHRRRCCAGSASSASTSRTCTSSESSLEDIFVEPGAADAERMNTPRDPRDLPLRDGAHVPHADAEHRLAGALDVAVLRRVRLGDRLAHGRDRRRAATAPSSCPA